MNKNSPGKHVACDQNGRFRMSSMVGEEGMEEYQALVGRVKPWFERFGIL